MPATRDRTSTSRCTCRRINLDPEQPAMPISHPSYYATYLAKRIGPFSTLGLGRRHLGAQRRRDRRRHLPAADLRHRSRAAGHVLRRARPAAARHAGLRVRRHRSHAAHVLALSRRRPSGRRDATCAEHSTRSASCTSATTRSSARCMAARPTDDVLMVLSDHGFNAFRRGVNLNAWLLARRLSRAAAGADGRAEWLRDVDWSRTRAYCARA